MPHPLMAFTGLSFSEQYSKSGTMEAKSWCWRLGAGSGEEGRAGQGGGGLGDPILCYFSSFLPITLEKEERKGLESFNE